MQRVFQRFVERLNESCDREGFHKAVAEAATAFDLTCFAYLIMPHGDKSSAALISNYPPAWTDHYLKARYEKLDPVIALAHRQTEPFEWGLGADTFIMSSTQVQLFDEASQFGIRCGFTIPIQYDNEPIAAVTFASDARRPAFRRAIESNKRVLQLMAILLHSYTRRRLHKETSGDVSRLTPRELECIHWAAEGKTAWETAQILKITERTVVWHIENAKRKLGVRTKCQIAKLLGRAMHNDNGVS